jgi:hypothetical protein
MRAGYLRLAGSKCHVVRSCFAHARLARDSLQFRNRQRMQAGVGVVLGLGESTVRKRSSFAEAWLKRDVQMRAASSASVTLFVSEKELSGRAWFITPASVLSEKNVA